jgi:hypothetical protein
MKEYAAKPLAWIQPAALKHVYELRSGDEVAGTLEWQEGLTASAVAKSADGAWTVLRQGFLRPRVTVRTEGSTQDTAVFEPAWSGSGDIAIGGGRRLRLVPANLWRSEWRVTTPDGGILLRMRPDTALVRTTAKLEIDPSAASMPELALLVFLSWSVLVLMEDDLAIYSI